MFMQRKVRRLFDGMPPGTTQIRSFAHVAHVLIENVNKEGRIHERKMRLKTAKIYAAIAMEAERRKENWNAVAYYVYAAQETVSTFKYIDFSHVSILQKLVIFNALLDAGIYLDRAERLMPKTANDTGASPRRDAMNSSDLNSCKRDIEHMMGKLKGDGKSPKGQL